MTNFTRTLSTRDAYQLKVQSIQKDRDAQVSSIENQIEQCESRIRELRSHVDISGCFLRIIRFVFGVATIPAFFLMLLAGFAMLEERDELYVLILIGTIIIIGIYVMLLIQSAMRKNAKLEREQEIEEYLKRIDGLMENIDVIEEKTEAKIAVLEQEYSNHMYNQLAIIENEMDSNTEYQPDDTKECPRCAEIIKAKAKICKYCKYSMDV